MFIIKENLKNKPHKKGLKRITRNFRKNKNQIVMYKAKINKDQIYLKI